MPRALHVVMLFVFCFSVALPAEAAMAAGVSAQQKSQWQRLVKKLEDVKKRQGTAAARRVYSKLSKAEQFVIRKGMRVHRVRVSGNGRLSDKRPADIERVRHNDRSSMAAVGEGQCRGEYKAFTAE